MWPLLLLQAKHWDKNVRLINVIQVFLEFDIDPEQNNDVTGDTTLHILCRTAQVGRSLALSVCRSAAGSLVRGWRRLWVAGRGGCLVLTSSNPSVRRSQ